MMMQGLLISPMTVVSHGAEHQAGEAIADISMGAGRSGLVGGLHSRDSFVP